MIEGESLYFEVNGCRGYVEQWKIDKYLGPAPYTVSIDEVSGVGIVCNSNSNCDMYNICALHNEQKEDDLDIWSTLNWYGAWLRLLRLRG